MYQNSSWLKDKKTLNQTMDSVDWIRNKKINNRFTASNLSPVNFKKTDFMNQTQESYMTEKSLHEALETKNNFSRHGQKKMSLTSRNNAMKMDNVAIKLSLQTNELHFNTITGDKIPLHTSIFVFMALITFLYQSLREIKN